MATPTPESEEDKKARIKSEIDDLLGTPAPAIPSPTPGPAVTPTTPPTTPQQLVPDPTSIGTGGTDSPFVPSRGLGNPWAAKPLVRDILIPSVTTPFSLPGYTEYQRKPKSVLQRVDDLIAPIEEMVLASIGLVLDEVAPGGTKSILNKITGESFSSFQERNRRSRKIILDAFKSRVGNPTDWFNTDYSNKVREDLKSVNVDRPFIESLVADISTAGTGLPKTLAKLTSR